MKAIIKWIQGLRQAGHFKPNSGQAIVIIAAAAIGLVAMMGLAIDGGRLLFLRRDTQNAADAAAVAAARALCTGRNPAPYALSAAAANGFDNNRTDNWVDVYAPPQHASFPILEDCVGCYAEVIVKGQIPPTFIGIVYGGELAAQASAIATCNPDITVYEPPPLRAVFAMGASCPPQSVTITGNNIYIEGGGHSNGTMIINPDASSDNDIVIGPTSVVVPKDGDTVVQGEDKVNWQAGDSVADTGQTATGSCLGSCFADPSGEGGPTGPGPYVSEPILEWPIEYDIADFQPDPPGEEFTAANAKGEFYEWDCSGPASKFKDWVIANHVTGDVMDDGIYYAECDIKIDKLDNIRGNVTIVSTGDISVSGDNQQWQPYTQNLLLFSTAGTGCEGGIQFSGSANTWNGNVFAPNGEIQMSASGNSTAYGCLLAQQVELSGKSSQLICDVDYEHTPQPGIWVSE